MSSLWILNHYAVPPTYGSGTRHYDFAEELVKRGHNVKIFASSFDHKRRVETLKRFEFIRRETINGVQFIWLRTFPYKKNSLSRILNIISFTCMLFVIGLFESRPKSIVASSFHPFTLIVGYFLSLFKGAKYIVEIRDLWPQTAIDMGALIEDSMIVRVLQSLEHFVYQKASKIIVLLPGVVNYIESLGINKEKVWYIPNGVSVARYEEIIEQVDSDNPILNEVNNNHKGNFKALYLGAHGHANALDVILDAAKIVQEKGYSEIDILLVGDGPEKDRLVQRVENERLTNVYFYDPVKKLHVPSILKSVNIGLVSMLDIPLYKYGISLNKIFDYLCAKKPVVFAGDVLNDIILEARAGITVKPNDPEAFAAAIIQMYQSTEAERIRFGENGKTFVKHYHDIPVLVEKIEKILIQE